MGEKQIDVAAIERLNVSIIYEGTIAFETGTDASTGIGTQDFTPYWVEDDSQEKLGSCLKQIYINSGGIKDTITNYNDYMNSVAAAFKAQDSALADSISQVKLSSSPAPKTASAELTAEEKLKIRSSEASGLLDGNGVR